MKRLIWTIIAVAAVVLTFYIYSSAKTNRIYTTTAGNEASVFEAPPKEAGGAPLVFHLTPSVYVGEAQ